MKTKLLGFLIGLACAGSLYAQLPAPFAQFPFNTNVLDSREEIQSIPSARGLSFVTDPVRGQVVEFDGVDGHIALGDNAFNFPALTYNIWFNWTTLVPMQWWTRLFDFGQLSTATPPPPAERDVWFVALFAFNDRMQINIHPDTWAAGTDSVLTSLAPINRNQWNMFTYVHDANQALLYLNGVLQDRVTLSNIPPTTMAQFVNLWIGRANWPDPLFTGRMDDFRIYNQALTAAQVSELFIATGGQPVSVDPVEAPAVRIFSFDDNIRVELPDYSNAFVEVYNLAGVLVYRQDIVDHDTQISGLNSGVYVVRVVNNLEVTTQKVLVQGAR